MYFVQYTTASTQFNVSKYIDQMYNVHYNIQLERPNISVTTICRVASPYPLDS